MWDFEGFELRIFSKLTKEAFSNLENSTKRGQVKRSSLPVIYQYQQCDQIGRFFCTLGKFLKPLSTIIFSKFPTFLGNFYRHLAIFTGHTEYQ